MLFSIRDSKSEIEYRLGHVLIVAGLALLLLWPLRTTIATVVYNNAGSVLLNRALLAPNLDSEARTEEAVRAGRAFHAALAWDPLDGQAYYNLAAVYALWQDTPSAERAVSRAAALAPRDVEARFAFGQALAAHGQEARAVAEWRAAGAAEYFVNRGLVLAGAGDGAGAVEQYERALAIVPDLADGYYYLGRALNGLGKQEESLAALESAAALEPPSSPRRYLLRAEVRIARQEWPAALENLGQAARLSPLDPAPHYRMGWVLEKLEDDAAAISHYQQALQINPAYVPPRLALGRLYGEQEACDEAARWLAPFLSQLPSRSDGGGRGGEAAHTLVGQCLLRQGRENEGLAHLEQALALDPASVPYTLALAQGYSQAGRYHDAIETYLRVLKLQPENSQAQQALEELVWFEQ